MPTIAATLPERIKNALSQYNLPDESISIHVETTSSNEQILNWRSDQLINPASTLKIITTYAGLDLLVVLTLPGIPNSMQMGPSLMVS